MDKYTALKQYYGHTEFRPGQEALIDALLAGRDVLGVMPTGAGKSVCYQIPALLLPGVTLVVSPLISLMQDQVAALTDAEIPAAFINSSLQDAQYQTVFRRALDGTYKIIYIAPERLLTDSFLNLATALQIALVAVDEAHCVSQWGQDFRPSYLKITEFIAQLPNRPVVGAFTATATDQVKKDIARMLALRDPLELTTGFDRPNLYFGVAKPKNKARYIEEYIRRNPDKSGIVYCATRKSVESVCEGLNGIGIAATRYHAGLSPEERRKNQEDFVYDRSRVMVATNAFGMGIDKSNVGYVLHYNMPKNLESYYQEAGRAGRDGAAAECILLFSPGDVQTARFFIDNTHDNDNLTPEEADLVTERDIERLDCMVGYCKTGHCLRQYLLAYFGEQRTGGCNNCSNCSGEMIKTDITTEAQKILSGVARVEKLWPGGLGANAVLQMLRGSKDQNTLKRGLDKLPTYGILRDVDAARARIYFDTLTEQGYLVRTAGEYPVLRLAPPAAEVLFHGAAVSLTERKPADWEAKADRRANRKKQSGTAGAQQGGDLYERLRAVRGELAQKASMPAYIIFSNATLADMAAQAPRTMDDFLQVSGVGEAKAKRYGKTFLKVIDEYLQEQE